MGIRTKKPPLYTLPHGIEVIGEYPPYPGHPYWRVRIRPHRFFSAPVRCGGVYVRRCRVVMSAHLGRKLSKGEHVHHGSLGKEVDEIENLTLLGAADHNRHHHIGFRHTEETKLRISKSLRVAYATGRRRPSGAFARKKV